MCETSDERLYYIRTSLMYTDLTRELLFKVFRSLIKRENITDFLTSPEQQTKIRELSKRNLLNKCDYNLVSGQVLNLERFDISLLIRLILNLCKDETPKPQLGWKTKPLPKDESLGADLLRLRNVRNKIIGHRADAKLSEAEYKQVWAKIKAILLRVIEQVDKDSREDFERRLNEYQQLNIDAEKSKVQRLLNELLQYKKEIDFLQEKNKDVKRVRNDAEKENNAEQNFQVNCHKGSSIESCPDMNKCEEHFNIKQSLQQNSSDQLFDSEKSKRGNSNNNTLNAHDLKPEEKIGTAQVERGKKQETEKNKVKDGKKDIDIETELESIKDSLFPVGNEIYNVPTADSVADTFNKFMDQDLNNTPSDSTCQSQVGKL